MATSAFDTSTRLDRERSFFFAMAIAIAATAVVGFGFAKITGMSSFASPWWVHMHALTMMGWVGIYVIQNALVWRGNVAAHRSFGRVGAAWSLWMLGVGITTTALSVSTHRAPPFFDPVFFLSMDWLNMLVFAGMAWAGIAMRGRTDWHRRLMLGATIIVLGPAWGRLMPLPLLREAVIWPISGLLLLYFAAGMIFDLRTRGSIHPAYGVGVAVMIGFTLLIAPLASLPAFVALAHAISG